MGIWDFIGSAAETVKQNAPDGTAVKDACRNSYSYGSTAFTKIDQVIRVNGPDDETKSKIGLFTTKFGKNAGSYALEEGYKLIPGGVVFSKILSETLNDVKHENLKAERLGGDRKLIGGANVHSGGRVEPISSDGYWVGPVPGRSLEDERRIFMMNEFLGNQFLDGLMMPARRKWKKPE